ncbi:hypothetical protein FA592_09665 [Sulfurospirillum diekertiae]|uniref:Uncharacterized protein n=1 Tax=Sulfurospirillum diekertiae TaxID=1854492 RepID=A0A1Y0HJY6_9BACT|nr:hypothetical protein [Sulfurospirillum diekertiae]ARU47704.1 hypothetical protein Sdiek1_0528 [Sulfurospirillum diekertiae]ASC92549.1 hypothetical protein Sdiek2_0518 [Sulfurospirillum diekertiae]QIR76484.1 hypothetical protein FA584_09825 [Sulfurospirillum diekertiae]QIR79113.1 hypothetical protein FA592_09665 [Sulfurospirillum diekertiae]
MKRLILLLTFFGLLSAENYTFLVQPYSKEIELEAKIISEIATSSLHEEIKLFIPNMSEMEKKVYSQYFTLTQKCETSNFVFVNKTVDRETLCDNTKRLFFTNNYRKLLSDDKYYGALFWNKSRPNIVFIKNRLDKKAIVLPSTFNQFIEGI